MKDKVEEVKNSLNRAIESGWGYNQWRDEMYKILGKDRINKILANREMDETFHDDEECEDEENEAEDRPDPLETMWRTYIASFYAVRDIKQVDESDPNGEIYDCYKYLASQLDNMCPICYKRDGLFFPRSDKKNMPPLHPNCACDKAWQLAMDKNETISAEVIAKLPEPAKGFDGSPEDTLRYAVTLIEKLLKPLEGIMKKCPYCAEEIQDEAIKCRYCGSDLQETSSPAVTGQAKFDSLSNGQKAITPSKPKAKTSRWAIAIIIGAACIIGIFALVGNFLEDKNTSAQPENKQDEELFEKSINASIKIGLIYKTDASSHTIWVDSYQWQSLHVDKKRLLSFAWAKYCAKHDPDSKGGQWVEIKDSKSDKLLAKYSSWGFKTYE